MAAVAAWSFTLGLQWPTLQVAAWFKMTADYQTRMSFAAAVTAAVTGPKCPLCLAIDKAQTGAKKSETPAPAPLKDATFVIGLPPAGDDGIHPSARRWTWPLESVRIVWRREAPPVLPPRAQA